MKPSNLDLLKSIPIPADIREGALALEGRVERLRKKSIACYVAAGIGAVLGLAAYGLSVWLSPDIYISSAHIPDEVLRVFSDTVKVTNGDAIGLQGAARSLGDFASSASKVIAFGAIVVGMGVGIVKQSIMSPVFGLGIALTVSTGSGIIGSMDGAIHPQASISEKRQLIQMVNAGDIDGVGRSFNSHKVHGSLADYVLAQTMLIRKKMEVDDKRVKTFDGAKFKELVLRVDQKAQDIPNVISPEVLMTLESQSLGKTQSAIAKQYEKTVLSKVFVVNTLEGVIKCLSFAFISLGMMLLTLRTVMQKRLVKITGLLNQYTARKIN